jgi:hypothetical protein
MLKGDVQENLKNEEDTWKIGEGNTGITSKWI